MAAAKSSAGQRAAAKPVVKHQCPPADHTGCVKIPSRFRAELLMVLREAWLPSEERWQVVEALRAAPLSD